MLEFGYVARAHGLKGHLVAHTHDPASTALAEASTVVARLRSGETRTLTIVEVKDAPKGELLVELEELTTREAAEAVVGATLLVERSQLTPPGPGEVFVGDLLGLEVHEVSGRRLGEVSSVFDAGAAPNLVLTVDGVEVMIPLVEDFVREVDLAGRRIVVVLPDLDPSP